MLRELKCASKKHLKFYKIHLFLTLYVGISKRVCPKDALMTYKRRHNM